MGAFFFLLAFAAIGFPGALTFIGEDLLLHRVLHGSPARAVTMLGASLRRSGTAR